MKQVARAWTRWVVLGVVLAAGSGCTSYLKRKELESVARDWCEVVRASQVLPVYPLTEDLQPGDVFLVTRPLGEESRLYRGRGFLPFEQHLARLSDLDYDGFYGERAVRPGPGTNGLRAAFPSYRFRVRSGSGLKLAIPVQGVPIGLNLLQTGDASGSVTVTDATTYGLSLSELAPRVERWSAAAERRAMFRTMHEKSRRPLHVRVVNRVYLARGLLVSVAAERTAGGQATGGAAPEMNLLEGDGERLEAYGELLTQLDRRVAEALPGGTLKFAQASGRAVTMDERFERPLVMGYLGFDFPILPDGSLGAPVSTLERVAGRETSGVVLGELTGAEIDYGLLVAAIQSRTPAVQEAIYRSAAKELGPEFESDWQSGREAGQPLDRAFSGARRQLLERRADAAGLVSEALRAAWKNQLGNP